MLTREAVCGMIDAAGLALERDAIVSAVQVGWTLQTGAAETPLSRAASKIGGLPDLQPARSGRAARRART